MRRSEAEGSRAGEAERTSDSEVAPRRRALRAIRTAGAPRATAGNAGKQGGRRGDGGAAATDSHPMAIS